MRRRPRRRRTHLTRTKGRNSSQRKFSTSELSTAKFNIFASGRTTKSEFCSVIYLLLRVFTEGFHIKVCNHVVADLSVSLHTFDVSRLFKYFCKQFFVKKSAQPIYFNSNFKYQTFELLTKFYFENKNLFILRHERYHGIVNTLNI